jgi:glutamyl-tRNA synthetase
MIAPRLRALGLNNASEAFWNAIRTNLSTLKETEDWWKVVQGPLAPRIDDPDFIREAAALLPPEPWNETTWDTWTKALKAKTGKSGRDLFQPLRLALTASLHGPEMKTLLPLIGRPRTEARLKGEKA